VNPKAHRETITISPSVAADGAVLVEIKLNSGERLLARGQTSGEVSRNFVIEARKRGWKRPSLISLKHFRAAALDDRQQRIFLARRKSR
jgi:hypothetical protein